MLRRGTKQDVIDAFRKDHDVNLQTARAMVDSVLSSIVIVTRKHDHLTLKGFGSFRVSQRKASTTVNPRTGQPMHIPASSQIRFRQSREI